MSFLGTFSAFSINGFQSTQGNVPFANATIIYPPNAFTGLHFGSDLELNKSGNTLIVGTETGNVAYIYTNIANVWSLHSTLTPNANISYGLGVYYGSSVSINEYGNIAAVGAPGANGTGTIGSGAIYIYEKIVNTWSQTAKIELANKATGDQFGLSISLNNSGNMLLASAPGKTHSPNYNGSVFLFTSSNSATWSQYNELINPNTSNAGNNFGQVIDLAGNANVSNTSTIVYTINNPAGSFGNDKGYIVRNNIIEFTYTSISDDNQIENVKINEIGNVVTFGMPYYPNVVNQRFGKIEVYKYANGNWSLNQTLTNSERLYDGAFLGWKGDITNDGNLIIGRGPGPSDGSSNYTATFSFANSTYNQSLTFVPPGTDRYRGNVSLNGNGTLFASGAVASPYINVKGEVIIVNVV